MFYVMLAAVLFCLLLIILVLLGKQYLLYKISYLPFLISKERKCYKQFKKSNAKTNFRKMQAKTCTLVFKDENTSISSLLKKCGLSDKDIVLELSFDTFQAYLIGDHILLISNTALITNSKKLRLISRSIYYLAKKIKRSVTMVSELSYQEAQLTSEDKKKSQDKREEILPNSGVINEIIKWSKAIEIYTTWFTGVEKLDGYKHILHFDGTLREYPSFIQAGNTDLADKIDDYFTVLHDNLTKNSFLQHAEKLPGVYVFIDLARRSLLNSLANGMIVNKFLQPSIKNIILIDLFKLNKKSPLNFIQNPIVNTKKMSGILMAMMIFVLMVFIGLFYTSAYKFRQGTLALSAERGSNHLDSKAINTAYNEAEKSKFNYFYSLDLLMGRRFQSMAHSIINNVLSKKMLDTRNLYIASLSLAVSSAAESPVVREVISANEFLISNVLEIPNTSVIVLAAQNYYIARQLPALNINDYEWRYVPEAEIEKYNQYYEYLIHNPELPFNNYIKFLKEYYAGVKRLKILKDMLGNSDVNKSLSKENLIFQTEVNNQIKNIPVLPADDVMLELQAIAKHKIKSTNEYADALNRLVKLYKKYMNLRQDVDSNILASAITSYALEGANAINEYNLPIIYQDQKGHQLSVDVLAVGDFKINILMMYTASFYKQLSTTLSKLGRIGRELNDLGLTEPGKVILNTQDMAKNKYAQTYIASNLKVIDKLNDIHLTGVAPEVLLALYSTPNSQFFQAMGYIKTNTQFKKDVISKDPLIGMVDDRFKLFDTVIDDKKFISAYQAIIANMAYNYNNNQSSRAALLKSMLTVSGETKSPLIKLQDLLKKSNVPLEYWPMFTAPIRLVMLYLRPVLLEYIQATWVERMRPTIIGLSSKFPFNKKSNIELTLAEFENIFGPAGLMSKVVTSAYIPFLELKENKYVITGVDEKDVPKKINDILHFITSHRVLATEIWGDKGERKADMLSVAPIQIPQKSIKGSYVVANYLNVGNDFMVNLPLNQNGKIMKYDWFNADSSIGIGWYGSQNKKINTVQSFSGINALFHLLYSADENKGDDYVWKVSGVNAIKFNIKSSLIAFIKEVSANE